MPVSTERQAEPGDLCTCGRPAVTVFVTPAHGGVGYCGLPDGGARTAPCPFCGATEPHVETWGDPAVCPEYRVRAGR